MAMLSSHSMEVMVAIVEIIIMMTLAMIRKEVPEVTIASQETDEAAENLTTATEMTMVVIEGIDQTDAAIGIEINTIIDLTEMAGETTEGIATTTDTLGRDQDRTPTTQEDPALLTKKVEKRTNVDKGEKEIAEVPTMVHPSLQQIMLHQSRNKIIHLNILTIDLVQDDCIIAD